MQVVRQHITPRRKTAGVKPADNIDLDEKIRRIREKNKEREQRFEEIEQDKMLAMSIPLVNKKSCKKDMKNESTKSKLHSNATTKPQQNEKSIRSMKGVHNNVKRTAKGRGQMLLEMSKHSALKAEHFESRTKNQSENFCHIQPETIKLKNNCRSRICEKIKTKGDAVRPIKNETPDDDVPKVEENLNLIPKDQHTEVPKEALLQQNKENDLITKDIDIKLEDIQEETPVKSLNENQEEKLEACENNKQRDTHTDLSDNLKKCKEQVNEIKDTVTTEALLETKSRTQKCDKPKITVNLRKTASSSSFDESMAMLSPLDLPQNWGDLDFSDNELEPVSLWKN